MPDSATKYTEATGGLRSVTPFEAPRRTPLVWGTADDSSGYLFPTPHFVSVSEYHLDRFSFISDPRRGCYIVLSMFIFFLFFPPQFCPAHISGTVTRRDSKLSVLLGPAV